MSQEEQVKTEKPTWSFPSARQTPTAYDVPATLDWVYDVPPGKMLDGWILDVKDTTTGAGMNLARVSQLIKKFSVFADGKLSVDVDQYLLDLLPIFTQWARHHDDYAELVIANALGAKVVQDDVNVATGAALYGYWKVAAPLPVKQQVRFHIEAYGGPTVFGAGQTGGVPQFSVVPIWAPFGKRKQYNIYAKQLSSVLTATYRGVEIIGMFTTAEWNTIVNGVRLGDPLTIEEIYAIQSNIGNSMLPWAETVGAVTNGRLAGIDDPLTQSAAYVLANKFDGQAEAAVSFSSANTVKTIVMSEASPEAIEVR